MQRADNGPIDRPHTTTGVAPLETCPRCDGSRFVVEELEDLVVFRCETCHRQWHYELGYVRPCGSR